MPLKEKFLSYVELQRAANDFKSAFGIQASQTIEAYIKANEAKTQVLTMIDELENGNDTTGNT